MKWLIIYNPFPNRCFNWLAFPQVPRVSNFKTFTNFSQPHSIKHSYTRAALVGRERRCVNLCHVCRLIENPWEHLSPWCQSVVPTSDSTEEVIWVVYNSAIMNREQQVDNVGRLWYCVCLSVSMFVYGSERFSTELHELCMIRDVRLKPPCPTKGKLISTPTSNRLPRAVLLVGGSLEGANDRIIGWGIVVCMCACSCAGSKWFWCCTWASTVWAGFMGCDLKACSW